MNNNLFRKEARDKKNASNFGRVFINTPVSYVFLCLGFSALTLGILLFILVAEVSEKFSVKGYLNSNKGVLRVYPGKQGIISKQYVKQGDKVRKGDPLYRIDTSYEGWTNKKHPEILLNLEKRKRVLDREIQSKFIYLRELNKLLKNKYIPLTTYAEKHEELVALKNNRQVLDMEIIRYKQERAYILRAPADGHIASLVYTLGQYANPAKPLLKILPDQAKLMLELFIPIQQAGFLSKNDRVLVHYDAYPYQRFGSYKARIENISQGILTDQEEEKPFQVGQAYYKVTASLEQQFVKFYGTDKALQQDMTVTAVIVGSKRKIWQWILDPIFSYYGEIFL